MNEIEITQIDVDELWIREWAALLIAQLETSLEKHAAFEQFGGSTSSSRPSSTFPPLAPRARRQPSR